MTNVTIAAHGDTFCIPCSDGYTTLGFDYAISRATRVAHWLQSQGVSWPSPVAPRGTLASYDEYAGIMERANVYCGITDKRCDVDLSPQLNGLEGRRVEVVDSYGETRRFKVGKSTGWLPCHLELCNARSTGGMAADRSYKSVRVV